MPSGSSTSSRTTTDQGRARVRQQLPEQPEAQVGVVEAAARGVRPVGLGQAQLLEAAPGRALPPRPVGLGPGACQVRQQLAECPAAEGRAGQVLLHMVVEVE